MKLYRDSSFFNPFFVDVNNSSYEISKIHFFNRDGIICSTRSGWFGSGDNNFQQLEINVDCLLKRKIDFNQKCAFIISSGVRNWDGTTKYELYIPATCVNLQQPHIANKTSRYFVIKWETDIKGVYCDIWHFVDGKLRDIEGKINNVGEKINNLYGDRSFNELPVFIEILSKLNAERVEEIKNIEGIDEEVILGQYRK